MRITHVSDLHFGHHDAALARGLAEDLESQSPDLIVVSGDFTQLGTREEFEAAHAFLRQLHSPVLAVPGNHDVPAVNIVRRLVDPYGLYRRYIAEDLEPFVEIDGVAIAGLRTVRRMRPGLNCYRPSGENGWVFTRYIDDPAAPRPPAVTTASVDPEAAAPSTGPRPGSYLASRSPVPVRSTPDAGAALSFVLAPGETFRVQDTRGRWMRVVTQDGYSGWIPS